VSLVNLFVIFVIFTIKIISPKACYSKLCIAMERFYFGKSSLPGRKRILRASRFPHDHNGYLLTEGKLPHGSEWHEPLSTWQFVEMHSIGCFYLIWGDIRKATLWAGLNIAWAQWGVGRTKLVIRLQLPYYRTLLHLTEHKQDLCQKHSNIIIH
jgi:hypothetical protein